MPCRNCYLIKVDAACALEVFESESLLNKYGKWVRTFGISDDKGSQIGFFLALLDNCKPYCVYAGDFES